MFNFILVREEGQYENMKMGKMIAFVVLIIIALAVSLCIINIFQKSSHDTVSNVPSSFPTSTVSNVPSSSPPNTPSNAQLNNAGYLEYSGSESKLFLVSANASYGVYSANAAWSGGTFDGKDCFVITATIRSDYTLEELREVGIYPGGYHSGRVYFAVSVALYDGASQVSANDVSGAIVGSMSPPLGVPQWDLRCGETDTVEIYLATNNRSIDSYSINLRILELSGLPIP